MRGSLEEMRLVSKTLVLFPHTASNQCFRPGGVTPIDSIVTAATAGQTLTGVMGNWGPPKMGTPGPHFAGKMGTRVPILPVKWGPGSPSS